MGLAAGIAGVHQDDVAGMGFADDALNDFVCAGIHPVEGIGVPLDGGVSQAVGDAEHPFVEVSVGEADQIGLFARQLGQDVIRLGDLLPDFLLAVGAVIVVPVAVTSDFIVHVGRKSV